MERLQAECQAARWVLVSSVFLLCQCVCGFPAAAPPPPVNTNPSTGVEHLAGDTSELLGGLDLVSGCGPLLLRGRWRRCRELLCVVQPMKCPRVMFWFLVWFFVSRCPISFLCLSDGLQLQSWALIGAKRRLFAKPQRYIHIKTYVHQFNTELPVWFFTIKHNVTTVNQTFSNQ